MTNISVNFENVIGDIKPMHAVNNGPIYKFSSDQRITNIQAWKDAGIPYARTHDSMYNNTYGGPHTVDVRNIFVDFEKDPYDPASYDFAVTDEYMRVIENGGTKVFYRLGASIEHWVKKYFTVPPTDFKKYAVICEHIIRHYTEGWADGFEMDIEYWEFWNEPDLVDDNHPNKVCWGGTKLQFFEFFDVVVGHLKECFPHLKIGGPAIAWDMNWADEFLAQLKVPIDFFSWHRYKNDPKPIIERAFEVRALLDKYGFTKTENILNEWNYVKTFEGQDMIDAIKAIKGIKGASFTAAVMCGCQHSPLDMLMYYDARPGGLNGMFNTDLVCECLKGYYPFKMFNQLYKLKNCVSLRSSDKDIYACAATNFDTSALMLTYFNDNDTSPKKIVKVKLSGLNISGTVKAEIYLLDEQSDMELIKEETFTGSENIDFLLNVKNFDTYLVVLSEN